MVKNRTFSIAIFLVVSFAIMTGCSNGTPSSVGETATNSKVEQSKDPVHLSMYQTGASISDEEFQKFIVEPVKKKYPYITIDIVRNGKGNTIDDLIGAGGLPDIIFCSSRGSILDFITRKVPIDLTEAAKSNQMDLGKFDAKAVAAIKAWGDHGELFGIPFSINFSAMYYNKDIFDKFGVGYPKDNMTWDETVELAKKVTRTDQGVQYFGIMTGGSVLVGSTLSLPYVDPKTMKATLELEGWKRTILNEKAIHDIPGMEKMIGSYSKLFYEDQSLAMLTSPGARVGELEELQKKGVQLNWDLATFPSFSDKPGIISEIEAHVMLISGTSSHKDDAFHVLDAVTERANQINMVKAARLSSLKLDDEIKTQFGVDLTSLKGKNIAGIFKGIPADMPKPTEFTLIGRKYINDATNAVTSSKEDVNTAISEANDGFNREIAETLKK
jgi:multiple sugar transport system substrate-binding protein